MLFCAGLLVLNIIISDFHPHVYQLIMLSIARIFVHLGCSNKIPEIRWLINNRDPFLTVLGDHKLRSGCQRGVSSVFWVADFRPCPSVAEGARELSGVPS